MKKILVGVDPSESSKGALRWALDQAAPEDTVIAVHAWEIYAVGGMEAPGYNPADFEVDATSLIKGIVAEVVDVDADDGTGPKIESKVVHGHAGRVLIELSDGVDMLVVGSRGYGGFRGLLLGSVSTYVVHHARCPVVVVPSQDGAEEANE